MHAIQTLLSAWPGILASDLARYLIGAGGLFLLVSLWARRRLMARKIQHGFPARRQLWREFAYSMSTVLIFSLVGLAIHLAVQAGLIRIYFDIGDTGWAYWGFSLLAMIVLHDAYFYWMHRLMHHPRLFRIFHRTHHRSRNPSPWAAYAFDPPEAVVQAAYLPLALLLLPVHASVPFLFLLHMIARNAVGHSGFELFPRGMATHPVFGWITSVTHHDLHHSTVRYNYGLNFTWWDRLMGTEHPRTLEAFAEVTPAPGAARSGPTAPG